MFACRRVAAHSNRYAHTPTHTATLEGTAREGARELALPLGSVSRQDSTSQDEFRDIGQQRGRKNVSCTSFCDAHTAAHTISTTTPKPNTVYRKTEPAWRTLAHRFHPTTRVLIDWDPHYYQDFALFQQLCYCGRWSLSALNDTKQQPCVKCAHGPFGYLECDFSRLLRFR